MLTTTLIIISAIVLDWLFGEPKRYHPLVGFGLFVNRVESFLYPKNSVSNRKKLLFGTFAVCLLLIPISLFCAFIASFDSIATIFSIVVLTLSIGHKSLHEHARPIADALISDDKEQARYLASRIVSRDPATLNIPRATIESVLENGADSVFSALFWFLVGGVPAVICYRLSNTLDAMWGYRSPRYLYFGRFAARLDDVLNYIPARLTALSYAIVGNTKTAFQSWKNQAPQWESPNAGPVMASGAGALQLILGGPAQYDGQWHQRITLGCGDEPKASDIERALQLVRRSVLLWIIVLIMITGLSYA
jgi:adenosylcobinamide-phosphate synthase